MDIILKDMNEEQLDLIKMALDNAMGHTDFDLKDSYKQLKGIRESLTKFSASLMTDEEVEQITKGADEYELSCWAEEYKDKYELPVENSNSVKS